LKRKHDKPLTNVVFDCKLQHYTAVDGSNVTAAEDGDDDAFDGARWGGAG